MTDWLDDTDETVETIDRTSRAKETRENETRKREWRPPSSLDAPPAPQGFSHRWIRVEINGEMDVKNVSAKIREGYELVRADDAAVQAAGGHYPVVDKGQYEGVIGVGGLLLARFPNEFKAQRDRHYRGIAENQMSAVDTDMLRENSHSSMRILEAKRQSHVTFGGPRHNED